MQNQLLTQIEISIGIEPDYLYENRKPASGFICTIPASIYVTNAGACEAYHEA